ATVITGGGVWISTTLFGGQNESEGEKTEQTAPAAAPVINLNLENNNQSNASSGGGGTTVIREKETIREVAPAPTQAASQPAAAPVEEKKETPAERMKRLRAKQAEQEGEE
ncbi:hypothetical protein EBU71_10240, partial [bacterium]|nr:hypothetical protein [Candidatus Elulimicrobium humile]